MKGWSFILLGVLLCWPGQTVLANPFKSAYVCVPALSPNNTPLEFDIRDSGSCKAGEAFMAVQVQKDGGILLLPSIPPLEPEVQKDFDAFKKYYGK